MKITPQVSTPNLSLKNTQEFIQKIYDDAEIGFDKDCVSKYEIVFDENDSYTVNAFYEYLWVKPKDAPAIYWPIQPYKEEFGEEASKKIIQELK